MRQCRIDPAVRHLLDCVHILILKLADFADLSEDFTVRSSHERGDRERDRDWMTGSPSGGTAVYGRIGHSS